MNDCMNKILQLLNDGRESYDNPTMYQVYMDGILDTLNAVNSCIKSKEDAEAGEGKKPTSFYRETISKRYIATTDADLWNAEKEMNRRIITNELYMTVNEWFDLLGLPHIENGDKLGWNIDTMFGIILFNDGIYYRGQPVELFPEKKIKEDYDIRYNQDPDSRDQVNKNNNND